ncbi:MAG: DUF4276 family protein [Caldilineaceae bacterium]
MARLIFHVEGVTEERFVNEVLAEHLLTHGWERVAARRMGISRAREQRHGIKSWAVARADIIRHLREDAGCCVTTFVDYYGLPATGAHAWPGRAAAAAIQPMAQRGRFLEGALAAAVAEAMGGAYAARRFIPFVVMHEFEGLLFSDCERFSLGIGRPDLAGPFQTIRNGFGSPEEIDDSPETAPSKRIAALIADYKKPVMGIAAALEIGLDAMRRACPHFHSWLERLETWPH